MSNYVQLGSQFQVNVADGGAGGIAGNQSNPKITVLADGRFVVVYQSDYQGNSSDIDPKVMIFNADGSFFTSVPITPYAPVGLQTTPVIAARADGGFGIVFTTDRHQDASVDASGANIQYVAVSAAGVASAPVMIADYNNFGGTSGHDALLNPAIATLSDGRQVIAYEQVYASGSNDDIRLNVVGTDGATLQLAATTGLAVDVNGGLQTNPAIAAAGSKAMVVYVDADNISAKIFDGNTNGIGSKIAIADHTAALLSPQVTALDSHRYLITYTDGMAGTGTGTGTWGKIYDTTTATLSSELQIVNAGTTSGATVAATSDGGFVATFSFFDDIWAGRFDANGTAIGVEFPVNTLDDGTQAAPSIAVSGDHLLVAWTDRAARSGDGSPTSVQAQAYALASSGSFNGVVTASDVSLKYGSLVDAASLFSTSGFDGNAVTKYQFWDSTAGGGVWALPSGGRYIIEPTNQAIDVSHAQLATAKFSVGSVGSSDDLFVRASDGVNWSAWKEFHVTAINHQPVVTPTAASRSATHNQTFAATTLFNTADGDGDTITQYRLWDTQGNGHWVVNNVAQGTNTNITINASDLPHTVYQAGAGTDQLYVQAFDGVEWGPWTAPFTVTGPADQAPVVARVGFANNTFSHPVLSLPLSSLFTFSDPEGDQLSISLWDTEGNGHWVVNGQAQANNAEIFVPSGAVVTYVLGAGGTTDHLYARAYDGTLWSPWASSTLTTSPNQKPVVTPTAASQTATHNQSFTAASLFTKTDGDGDTITKYALWDTQGNGHWIVNGVAQAPNTEIDILASDTTSYQAGAGTDQLYVKAFDGHEWGTWTSAFTVTGPADGAPTVTAIAASRTLAHGVTTIALTSLAFGTDPEGDSATKVSLWDTEGNGHWVVNGVAQATNAEIVIDESLIASTVYAAGATGTTDHLYVRSFDGSLWSPWASFTVTAAPNHAPVVTHNFDVYGTQTITHASFMFGATDADNDTIQKYQLWDDNADPTSGYWSVGGVALDAKVAIDVTALQVANNTTDFVTRGYNVSDDLYVRAFDGFDWSPWTHFVDQGQNQAPYALSAPDVTATHNQSFTASSLFNWGDPQNTPITQYELWDSTADPLSGHWVVGGVAQGANVTIGITAAQLNTTSFQSASGSDDLWVRASDGTLWGDWKEFHVNAPVNHAPVVGGGNVTMAAGTAAGARVLFTETDADNDTMTAYQFWADNAAATSGYFVANGQAQTAGHAIDVSAAQLSMASFVAGATGSQDKIYERAFDGTSWSDWHSLWILS